MAVNASGDSQATSLNSGVSSSASSSTFEASGPMGDASQKRPLEDAEEPGAKKIATFTPGSVLVSPAGANLNNSVSTMSKTMKLPDDLVGLIIGRGGENIMRMQRETGCRIQITQSIPGTKERPCTLSGTPEQIEVCRNMLTEIVSRSQAGGLSNLNIGGAGIPGGGMGEGTETSVVIPIPPDKCGLIIGKGGETIKMLQQNLGVKMLLIQDTTENLGMSKPLKISGTQANVDNAANAIHQMMAQRDKQIAEQKMNQPSMAGSEVQVVPVPKPAVGVVIGKGGDMINQIQNVTATRVQFKPEDANLPERLCTITGSKEGVDAAMQRIHEIIQNVQERDGDRGGNMRGFPTAMSNFGQWEGPGGNRGRGVSVEHHLVPANKTGLVIGKGGDTIKQINMQSGAHAEIEKNPPPGADLNYKTFIIKGTPEQIKMARQLIQDKVDANNGLNGAPMGIPQQAPPQRNFLPRQQNAFNPLTSGANFAPQNSLQAPLQVQPGQTFPQQPWGGQFQQWTPPSASAASAPPQAKIGAPPAANTAAWPQVQMYGQSQAAFQPPAASVAPAPAATVTPAVPDYSKQWDEYLKQTGAFQAAAAAAAAAAATPASAAAANLVQQPVAAAPAPAPAVATQAASTQPATTQADYTAAWAEYYRQYYELQAQAQAQGQQYSAAVAAAAAGQPPAQN